MRHDSRVSCRVWPFTDVSGSGKSSLAFGTVLLGAPATQPSAADERTAFYLCNPLILLKERVFLDLDLEGEGDHPHNRGWVTLFQQWAAHPQFRAAWTATSSGYGMRFQQFVREVVGLT
jgi:hypothetical protein